MTGCPREAEVFEAVAFNRIADLADHLAACAICAEIADVAGALQAEHVAACREAPVPSAGAVWWRATVRARAEAARTVAQPITLLQGIAGACGVGVAAALVTIAWRAFDGMGGLDEIAMRLGERRDDIAAASALLLQHGLPIMLALAACLVIAPVAIYLAFGDD
jgi:hypothetical protein